METDGAMPTHGPAHAHTPTHPHTHRHTHASRWLYSNVRDTPVALEIHQLAGKTERQGET